MARQWAEGCQVLTHYEDKAVIDGAAAPCGVPAAWPQLRAHVDLDDPASELARYLWELTLIVGERAAAREQRRRLMAAGRGLPADTPTAAALADRIELARHDADTDQRRGHLRRLADEVGAFVAEQQALERAAATIRDVDRLRGTPAAAQVDAAGDLADHSRRDRGLPRTDPTAGSANCVIAGPEFVY